MDLKGYKRVKKIDIKGWLLRGNAIVYAFILGVFIVAVIFMFNTVGSMFKEDTQQDTTEESIETSTYIADNQSYMISVNKTENFITIYKIDTEGGFTNPYKTFRCSVSDNVAVGETKINEKYVWRRLSDNVYGHYTSGLANQAYIHSVPYSQQSNSSLIAKAYNNLGNTADIGSIYLAVADAKWIYENCGINSIVNIYEEADETPLIALNEFSKISLDSKYDPTDNIRASEDGKVDTKIDYMTGVDDCTIRVGEAFDRWAGVYAVDMSRNDITSYITITGELDVSTPGVYTLIYHLEDNYGTSLAYWRYITVTNEIETETQTEIESAVEETTTVDNLQNGQLASPIENVIETTTQLPTQTQPVESTTQLPTQPVTQIEIQTTVPEVTTAPTIQSQPETQPTTLPNNNNNENTQSLTVTNN